MFYQALNFLDKHIGFDRAKAHCDVPCGIYDPIPAQIAAMSVIRMVDTITDLENHEKQDHGGERDAHYNNKITRMINEKEKEAEKVKHEIRVIWGDFFKAPQFEQFPQIHSLTHEIMLLGSKAKQNVDREASVQLLDKVNEFAEIFYKVKNISTKKVTYHCKPNLEMVFPDL